MSYLFCNSVRIDTIDENNKYDIKSGKGVIRIIISYKYDIKTIIGMIVFLISYGLVFAEKICTDMDDHGYCKHFAGICAMSGFN